MCSVHNQCTDHTACFKLSCNETPTEVFSSNKWGSLNYEIANTVANKLVVRPWKKVIQITGMVFEAFPSLPSPPALLWPMSTSSKCLLLANVINTIIYVKRMVKQLKWNIGNYVAENSTTAKGRCGAERLMEHVSPNSVQYWVLPCPS